MQPSPPSSSRKEAPYFVSYAQHDMKRVDDMCTRLVPHLAASRRYVFERWKDTDLLVGERWNNAILQALERHCIGLLMISPTFLVRPYILREELPRLLAPGRIVVPVLLHAIDLQRQDAHGLEALQIFALREGGERRAYADRRTDRDAFAFELFKAIEARLDRDL